MEHQIPPRVGATCVLPLGFVTIVRAFHADIAFHSRDGRGGFALWFHDFGFGGMGAG